jgi:hypothetical protein
MLRFLITGKANCLLQKCLYISTFSKWKGWNARVWGELKGAGYQMPVSGANCREDYRKTVSGCQIPVTGNTGLRFQ